MTVPWLIAVVGYGLAIVPMAVGLVVALRYASRATSPPAWAGRLLLGGAAAITVTNGLEVLVVGWAVDGRVAVLVGGLVIALGVALLCAATRVTVQRRD